MEIGTPRRGGRACGERSENSDKKTPQKTPLSCGTSALTQEPTETRCECLPDLYAARWFFFFFFEQLRCPTTYAARCPMSCGQKRRRPVWRARPTAREMIPLSSLSTVPAHLCTAGWIRVHSSRALLVLVRQKKTPGGQRRHCPRVLCFGAHRLVLPHRTSYAMP